MSKAIIIVSFGTANLEGLKVIEDFEAEVAAKFSGNYRVYKVFTSSVISNLLLNKHGKVVPRLEEVLFRLNNEKYKEVYRGQSIRIYGAHRSRFRISLRHLQQHLGRQTLDLPRFRHLHPASGEQESGLGLLLPPHGTQLRKLPAPVRYQQTLTYPGCVGKRGHGRVKCL